MARCLVATPFQLATAIFGISHPTANRRHGMTLFSSGKARFEVICSSLHVSDSRRDKGKIIRRCSIDAP